MIRNVRPGWRVGVAVAAVCLAAAACSSPGTDSTAASGGGAGLTAVKMQFTLGTATSWPAYVAEQEGFFHKNGLDVQFVSSTSAPSATAALVGGGYDVAVIDLFNTAPLLEQGQNLKLITEIWPIPEVLLAGKSGRKAGLGQLMPVPAGTVVSAPSSGGASALEVKYVQEQYGGKASDIKVAADPSGAGLLSGQSKYQWTDPATECVLTARGASLVFDMQNPTGGEPAYPKIKDLFGLPDNGLWATGSWVSSHQKAIGGLQTAIEQADQWMVANPGAAAKLLRGDKDFNAPSLSDTQWQNCVTKISKEYSTAFPPDKVAPWSSVLQQMGVISKALPPLSNWAVSGLPSS